MADEDEGESWKPEDDEPKIPKDEQEKLKLELMKLNEKALAPANFDVGSQPAVQNPDGSISTVRTIGANVDGEEVNLPTVSKGGVILSDKEAINEYVKTGRHLGKYATPEDAAEAAQRLHDTEAEQISQHPKDAGPGDPARALGIEKLRQRLQTYTPPDEKPVETQDGSVTMDPDTPQFQQPNYEPQRGVNIRTLSTEGKPGAKFSPEVERAIDAVKHLYPNMTREQLAGYIQVESTGQPRANEYKPTQYKGLLQIGREEWQKHGGDGDIYDAEQNLRGGASLMEKNRQDFIRNFKREPTPAELYLVHQQGLGFYTRGAMTNIAGNLPPHARTPENMTHEGFERWWTARINRAIAERGKSPTMSKVEDSNLPAGFLYPGSFADLGGPPLTQGGLNETPAQQAMIAELMRGTPLAQQGGTERAANEAAARAERDPTIRNQPRSTVPVSRERMQVPGQLPVSVSHTEPTFPMPGIMTPGERLIEDATNPSLFSTMQNWQGMQPTPKPPAEMRATPTFVDKLKDVLKRFAPSGEAGAAAKEAAIAELRDNPLPNRSVVDWLKELEKKDQELAQGVVSGIQHLPTDLVSALTGFTVGGVGRLAGSDELQRFALQTQADAEAWKESRQKSVGIDPANPTSTQALGTLIGSNAATSIPGTLLNMGMSTVGQYAIGPAADWLGKNVPIPNLNPIQPAHAASVFGKPPMIINTPGGPVVMNDASIPGMVWGGVLSLGFGAGIAHATPVARYIIESKPMGWSGMYDLFDPRRKVPGAPGTTAASRASDIMKGGIVDRTEAMLDIANRQTRYETGLRTGIDPIAADAVRQKWRYQTGSGAQNLIQRVIKDGKMNTDDFRFDVDVSIANLHEFSKVKPDFPEYLKLRMVQEELSFQKALRDKLPQGSQKGAKYPSVYKDSFDNVWDLPKVKKAIDHFEQNNPEFTKAHADYVKNLEATREFVSGTHNNGVEDFTKLTDHAMKRPTAPIFSDRANGAQMTQIVLGGVNPLSLAETAMKKAIANQMKVDAEVHYRNVSTADAFTPRTPRWVKNRGGTAIEEGAVFRRKIGGKTQYWTADPLIVSMMNADTVPLQGWGRFAATAKDVFQTTTTGGFAPWFAPTGMIRAMEQGWTTAPMGVKSATGHTRGPAGPFGTFAAILEQTIPRGVKLVTPTTRWFESIIQNSDLGQKFIDPKYHNLMSRAMEKAYNDSFYKLMLDNGAYSGKTLQHDYVTHANITQAKLRNQNKTVAPIYDYMEKALNTWNAFAGTPLKGIGKGINESLRAVQEAPGFAWARKVGEGADDVNRPTINGRPMSNAELAARMRNYTGDPSTRGFIYSQDFRGNPETLRFSGPGERQAELYKGIGQLAHGMRVSTPWAGVLIQSPAATIKALRDNPIRANMAFTASAVLPEMVAYIWNTYHGQQYVDYQMDGRGNNPFLNNVYFAVPGEKPENGIEFRHFQETIFQRYMARAFMHQYMGRSMHNMWEDVQKGLWGFLGGAIIPPQPSWLTALYGMNNMVAPEGFMGGLYRRKNNPFVTLGGGESWVELTARAIAPSISDMTIAAYNAGREAPNWPDAVKAGAEAVGSRAAGRTFGLDSLGFKASVAGSTVLSEELWKRKQVIDDLLYRFGAWDTQLGGVVFKDASIGGGKHAGPFLPEKPRNRNEKNLVGNPGMPQHEPINPLYKLLMVELENTFKKDDPEKGGIGWKTMWKHYMGYGSLANRMNTTNAGNKAAWRDTHTDVEIQELKDNKVDPDNYNQVKDFWNARRNEVAKVMLRTIVATEQRLDQLPEVRKMLGDKKHFTINMLDPNKVGIELPEDVEEYPGND